MGPDCSVGPPDTSSIVTCRHNVIMAGEILECTVVARRDGVVVNTTADHFRCAVTKQSSLDTVFGPLTDTATVHVDALPGKTPHTAAAATSTSEFHVQFRSVSPSQTLRPEPLFHVFVTGGTLGAAQQALLTPHLLVLPRPDATTTMSCAKAELLPGEQTRCIVAPRAGGVDILATPRAIMARLRDTEAAVATLVM